MSSREHSAGANELLNQRLCFIKLTPHYYQTEAPFPTHVCLLQRQKIISASFSLSLCFECAEMNGKGKSFTSVVVC